MVVAFILIAWVCAIIAFLQKWGKIHIVHNQEPLRHTRKYKNLDTIKVVKKPTDSVIFKSYTSQVSKTMRAREKHIERINTMPNIKIAETDIDKKDKSFPDYHKKMMERVKTIATIPALPVIDSGEFNSRSVNQVVAGSSTFHSVANIPVLELDENSSDNNQTDT